MRISNIIALEILYFWLSFLDEIDPFSNLEESLKVGVGFALFEVGVGGKSRGSACFLLECFEVAPTI